jgi:hypothetical protein
MVITMDSAKHNGVAWYYFSYQPYICKMTYGALKINIKGQLEDTTVLISALGSTGVPQERGTHPFTKL